MEDWQTRIIDEYCELTKRCLKLQDFLESDAAKDLSAADVALLKTQYSYMQWYRDILMIRIERFGGTIPSDEDMV